MGSERFKSVPAGMEGIGTVLLAVAVGLLPELAWPAREASESPSSAKSIRYDVALPDPVQPGLPARLFPVELALSAQGFPETYRLSLGTGVCMEQVCKPLRVTLFWDALGNYTRLEYSGKAPLTKHDHAPFGLEDYVRLDAILKDKRSLLGTQPLSNFVRKTPAAKTGIDGVTTATPQAVREAVVSGAAYTSWVLWRWANGEITGKLLALTRSMCDADYLNHCLLSDDSRFVQFALQHLLDKELYAVRYREACFRILGRSGRTNCQLALRYLAVLPQDADELNTRLITLMGVNAGSGLLLLERFEKLSDAPPALWVQMAAHLEQVNTYYDAKAMLALLKRRAADSEDVRREVSKLLRREDRFIALLAQEFLEKEGGR